MRRRDIDRSQSGAPQRPGRRAGKVRRWLWWALLSVIATYFFVTSPSSASFLIQSTSQGAAEFVLVAEPCCGPGYAAAVEFAKTGQLDGVLLPHQECKRLILLGVVPPIEAIWQQKLISDGVSPEQIQMMEGVCRREWDVARNLDRWLSEHAEKRVRLMCDLFSSRRWSVILHQKLQPENQSRVTILGLIDPRFDQSNWWKSRAGIKSFFHNLFRLEYALWFGESRYPVIDWSPEKYEEVALQQKR